MKVHFTEDDLKYIEDKHVVEKIRTLLNLVEELVMKNNQLVTENKQLKRELSRLKKQSQPPQFNLKTPTRSILSAYCERGISPRIPGILKHPSQSFFVSSE